MTGGGPLAVVGTAGRAGAAPRLTPGHFEGMCELALAALREGGHRGLVSGGAPWADHAAVALALRGDVPPGALELHLPAELLDCPGGFEFRGPTPSNRLHRAFGARLGIDSLGQVALAVALGARATAHRGFLARDRAVARSCSAMLAFTFGSGEPWRRVRWGPGASAAEAGPAPGGTARTWDMCRAPVKIHVALP